MGLEARSGVCLVHMLSLDSTKVLRMVEVLRTHNIIKLVPPLNAMMSSQPNKSQYAGSSNNPPGLHVSPFETLSTGSKLLRHRKKIGTLPIRRFQNRRHYSCQS